MDNHLRSYELKVLKVSHKDDFLTNVTLELPVVVTLSYLSLVKGDSHMILHMYPPHKDLLLKFIDIASSYKDVKSLEVYNTRKLGSLTTIYMVKKNFGVLKAMAKVGVIKAGPVVVHKGIKHFPVLMPESTRSKLVYYVRKYAPCEVMVKVSKPDNLILNYPILENLTLTETEYYILLKAYNMGYFDWPKKIRLETLAKELGVSRSTALEHLRKSIKKLLDMYFVTNIYFKSLNSI